MTLRVIPVPIPNTEVKPKCAENTCGLPCWEDRLLLVFFYTKIKNNIEINIAKTITEEYNKSRDEDFKK